MFWMKMIDKLALVFIRILRMLKKSRVLKNIRKKKLARIALIVILLFYVIAGIGWMFAPHDPLDTNLDQSLMGPSRDHIFGTDRLGRDVFSRVLYAMRTTAIVSLGVLILGGVILNVGLALIAGYYGGRRDSLILKIGEVLGSVPPLILMILIAATFGPHFNDFMRTVTGVVGMEWLVKTGISDIFLIIFVLSLIFWVGGVMVLRSRILTERELGYVESARALGASDKRIMISHILPNVMGLIVLSLSSILVSAISAEISLSFLGLGIKEPYPSFGIMFYELINLPLLQNHPHLLIFPGMIVIIVINASWIIGDALASITESRKSY